MTMIDLLSSSGTLDTNFGTRIMAEVVYALAGRHYLRSTLRMRYDNFLTVLR